LNSLPDLASKLCAPSTVIYYGYILDYWGNQLYAS
jgi:hypothetical protein